MIVVNFNGNSYTPVYNDQSGYYELELQAPMFGGIYEIEVDYRDILGNIDTATKEIQVLAKEQVDISYNKTFMWVFNGDDFSVRGAIEIDNYEINLDEETNATSMFNILKDIGTKANDLIAIKKDGQIVYWGIVEEVSKEGEGIRYQYSVKYITNLFDRFIELGNSSVIRTTGLEDFIANEIVRNFTNSTDTITNMTWLDVEVLTHTPKETSVTNVENNIYNLHTWMTNCTQNYDITYDFKVENNRLKITIENKSIGKELIDVNAQPISDYVEVFETDVMSKVIVLYNKVGDEENPGTYTLYLLNDRSTTTDMNNPNRAKGKIKTIFTENYEDANQSALDEMKSNSYNHNITFSYFGRYIKLGTPIAIKTKNSKIYDTYISAIKMTEKNSYEYTCGNIRINFIDKLLKEKE